MRKPAKPDVRPQMPSLAPIPAPLARIAEQHRTLLRAASRLGLDLNNREHWPAIARDIGWDWPLSGPTAPRV